MNDSMTGRLRIAVVSHAYNDSEVIKTLESLSRHMDVLLLTPRQYHCLVFRNASAVRSEAAGLQTKPVRVVRLGRSQYLALGYRKTMARFRPDVVWIEYDPWSVVFHLASLAAVTIRPRPRIVLLAKKNTYRRLPTVLRWGKAALAKLGLARTDMIIAASTGTRNLYTTNFGVPGETIVVQPCLGIDTSHFRPVLRAQASSAVTIGFVGKISVDKGIVELLTAVGTLCAQGVRLVLALLGPVRDEELAKAVSGKEWVTIESRRPNHQIPEFLQSIDIFVMPTRVLPDHQEQDARALLEAMSCGLPSIVTSSGIMPEIVDDECGRVCKPNDPGSLVAAISELAADPIMRGEMGARARERVVELVDIVKLGEARYELCRSLTTRSR
jgi:glycosyltransferase involved in cell wall biosynthesis